MDVGFSFWTSTTGSSLVNVVPDVIAWAVGAVLAVIMIKRGGLKAEKLLLIGCCLMLAESIISPVVRELLMNLGRENGLSYASIALYITIPQLALSLAGFICLVIAFWTKFRVKKQETA